MDRLRQSQRPSPDSRSTVIWTLAALMILLAGEAAAMQRVIRARVANHDKAPVSLDRAHVELAETYSTPSQFPFAVVDGSQVNISRSHVRYLNRLNQMAPTYTLEGEFEARNDGRKEVQVLELTAVSLNAFHERISSDEQPLAQTLPARASKRIRWSRSLPNEDIFEIVFAVTAVRFSDGTVWKPTEELILFPQD